MASTVRELPSTLAHRDRRARQGRGDGEGARPVLGAPDPRRPRAAARQQGDDSRSRSRRRRCCATTSGRSCARRARWCASCSPSRTTSSRPSRSSSAPCTCSTACSTCSAYNPNGPRAGGQGGSRRGLPLLLRLARPPERADLQRPGRARRLPPVHLRRHLQHDPQHGRVDARRRLHRRRDRCPLRPERLRRRRGMNKEAPSPLKIFAMVAFALSCFGLLLFLWLSFGGPVPLKPKGYRVQVAFPEADAARRRGRRALGRRADRQGALQGPRPAVQPHAGDDRDRPPLRAGALGREGDAAPEDAARGDLRRDDAGHAGRRVRPRGRPARQRPGAIPPSSSTRSSTRSTRTRGARSGPGSRTSAPPSTAAGATSTTPSGTCPASSRRAAT